MEREEARVRLAGARVGHLATSDVGGLPHVNPLAFALDGDTIYWTVDDKPKRSMEIKRVQNIRANPNVQVVVDHYEDDWAALWWVRASGTARMVEGIEEGRRALALLADKYPPYRDRPPRGPIVAIDIARLTWWEGGPQPPLG